MSCEGYLVIIRCLRQSVSNFNYCDKPLKIKIISIFVNFVKTPARGALDECIQKLWFTRLHQVSTRITQLKFWQWNRNRYAKKPTIQFYKNKPLIRSLQSQPKISSSDWRLKVFLKYVLKYSVGFCQLSSCMLGQHQKHIILLNLLFNNVYWDTITQRDFNFIFCLTNFILLEDE